jgi:GAF domain-containing protein
MAIQRATTPLGIARSTVRAAAEICEADSAVWWEQQQGGVLTAKATRGLRLAPRAKALRVHPRLWKTHVAGQEHVIQLSQDRAEHAALLSGAGAPHGILIRARASGRWTGALSVHAGKSDTESVNLLAVLCQQCALALHAMDLRAEPRRIARGQERASAEIDLAVTSALNLDELLVAICRTAVGLLPSACCFLFLAEDGGPMALRAREFPNASCEGLAETALWQLAEHTRSQSSGPSVWHTGRRLSIPGGEALESKGIRSVLGHVFHTRGQPVGALILLSPKTNAFTAARRQVVASFVAQTSRAIENLQLVEGMQRRLLELADLTWVSTRISSALDVERIAATVAAAAAKALDVPRAGVLLTGDRGELQPIPGGYRGLPPGKTDSLPAAGHLAAEALSANAPQAVSDVDREGIGDDALVRWLEARSVLCVPMTAQQGLRGVLAVADARPRHFAPHMIALLSAYANQTALALQSALLYEDVVRHLNELGNLFEVSQALASSLDLTETLERVLDSASELLDAPVCSLRLVDPDSKELVIKATRGIRPDHELYAPVKPGQGLAGLAAESKSPLVSADVSRDGRFKHRVTAREQSLRTAIVAPLLARGRTVGVLNLYRKTPREFSEDDKRLVMALANSAAVAIEHARLYEEAHERTQFLTAMMGEINHRMRNTLQAVAGLLRMELEAPQPRSTETALRRGIARLQSVAVVHEMMQARDIQLVDIKQAARRITQLTCQTAAPARDIQIRVSGARVLLPSQQATNAALILSELVDNAARHGLAEAAERHITVSFAEAGGSIVMEVRDNGVGLPDGFDLDTHSGLGLKLVRGLVEEDLGGKLELGTRGGLRVRARFPKHT